MSSLWTDLLFLHGHVPDWRLAHRMAGTAPAADDADAMPGNESVDAHRVGFGPPPAGGNGVPG